MGRVIIAAVVGYIAMFVTVMLLMAAAYLAVGADGAFQPGTWEVSSTWLLVSVVVGFAAGIDGGVICALIARGDERAVKGLIAFVVVLGLLMAVPAFMAAPDVGPRPEVVAMGDAMMNGRQPGWVALLNPVIGAVGVFLGARLVSRHFAGVAGEE